MKNKEENKHTHKAVVTMYSNGEDPMVSIKVEFDPDLAGDDIEELGYLPTAFALVQDYLWPAIEEAKKEWETNPMILAEPGSTAIN